MSEDLLKSKYSWKLRTFVAINLSLFCIVFQDETINLVTLTKSWQELVAEKSMVASGALLLTLVLNSLLSSHQKAQLIFWRRRNPLPGCRAFSELQPTDPRIDRECLCRNYGELPTSPEDQNKLWYKIYKHHESRATVRDAQYNFLFFRDMAAIGVILGIVCLVILMLTDHKSSLLLAYFGFITLQYIVLAIGAQNHGKRFACNVLAEASTQ